MKSWPQIGMLALSLGVCFATAWFGSRFMPGEWYSQLQKPSWTPPNYLFGPVWTLLYILMAVAAWMVWRQSGIAGARLALSLFIIQLVLNGIWSWIFFGMHKVGLAFIEVLLLWIFILTTTISFWNHYKLAGILFLPYLAWVSFASVLNFAIWRINTFS